MLITKSRTRFKLTFQSHALGKSCFSKFSKSLRMFSICWVTLYSTKHVSHEFWRNSDKRNPVNTACLKVELWVELYGCKDFLSKLDGVGPVGRGEFTKTNCSPKQICFGEQQNRLKTSSNICFGEPINTLKPWFR